MSEESALLELDRLRHSLIGIITSLKKIDQLEIARRLEDNLNNINNIVKYLE